MRHRVYIETTIPSFYYNEREELEMLVRGNWTRRWWDHHRSDYELYTSAMVTSELRNGDHPRKSEKLALLQAVPMLAKTAEIELIAATYVQRFLMPSRALGDAFHLAFASHYHCDILLTWNCVHLANVNKIEHMRSVNATLGLPLPQVITPMQLLGENVYE